MTSSIKIEAHVYPHLKICRSFFPTGHQLWVDCLISPTLIARMFIRQHVRAQRECDWLLNVNCLRKMLPYFYVASHWHHERHITRHLQEMSCLYDKSDLIAGAFVAYVDTEKVCGRRSQQISSGNRLPYNGKSKAGLVGISLSAEQVACCTLSYRLYQRVSGLQADVWICWQ